MGSVEPRIGAGQDISCPYGEEWLALDRSKRAGSRQESLPGVAVFRSCDEKKRIRRRGDGGWASRRQIVRRAQQVAPLQNLPQITWPVDGGAKVEHPERDIVPKGRERRSHAAIFARGPVERERTAAGASTVWQARESTASRERCQTSASARGWNRCSRQASHA